LRSEIRNKIFSKFIPLPRSEKFFRKNLRLFPQQSRGTNHDFDLRHARRTSLILPSAKQEANTPPPNSHSSPPSLLHSNPKVRH